MPMPQVQHTKACQIAQAAWQHAMDEFGKAHPRYCHFCQAVGYFNIASTREQPEEDAECPVCVAHGRCPLCGADLKQEDLDEGKIKCDECGYNWEKVTVLPPQEPICHCSGKDPDQ